MTSLSLVLPEIGVPDLTEDPKIVTAFSTIQVWANGNIDSTNLKAGSVNEDRLSAAVQALLNQKVSGLTLTSHGTSTTAVPGELALMEGSGTLTVTLPATSLGRTVGVFCGPATTSVIVEGSSSKRIYGDFIDGSETFIVLAPLQHVILQANASAWFITAGEPKIEPTGTGRNTRVSGAKIVASSTRPAHVVGEVILTGAAPKGVLSIGSQIVSEPEISEGKGKVVMPVSFWLPAGAEYSFTEVKSSASLSTSHYVV